MIISHDMVACGKRAGYYATTVNGVTLLYFSVPVERKKVDDKNTKILVTPLCDVFGRLLALFVGTFPLHFILLTDSDTNLTSSL